MSGSSKGTNKTRTVLAATNAHPISARQIQAIVQEFGSGLVSDPAQFREDLNRELERIKGNGSISIAQVKSLKKNLSGGDDVKRVITLKQLFWLSSESAFDLQIPVELDDFIRVTLPRIFEKHFHAKATSSPQSTCNKFIRSVLIAAGIVDDENADLMDAIVGRRKKRNKAGKGKKQTALSRE